MSKFSSIKNRYIIKDEFTKQSGIILVTTLIAGFLNYVYHIYIGRVLGPEEYGVFGALFAILYMAGIISQTLSTSMTNFVSKFMGEGKKIGFLITGSIKRSIIFGVIISVIFIIFDDSIRQTLKIPNPEPIYILAFILFLNWIYQIMFGILRGTNNFASIGFANISNSLGKLIFGIMLVTLGYKINGAMLGVALGMILAILISYLFIKPYIIPNNPHDPEFEFSSFYRYSIPVLLVMIGSSIPANFDVILAKYFFTATEAGIYASASIFGKIIFFFPMVIGTVIFPMIVERYSRGENVTWLLKRGLSYTTFLSGSVLVIYYLFPDLTIKLFGQSYKDAMILILPYGLAMFSFSITMILMYYHLATRNMTYISLFIIFAFIQGIALLLFHSTILEMVTTLYRVNIIFSILSIIYTYLFTYT